MLDRRTPPARVALALRKPRELDIIEQPRGRVSQIADLLIEHVPQSLQHSGRIRAILADTDEAAVDDHDERELANRQLA